MVLINILGAVFLKIFQGPIDISPILAFYKILFSKILFGSLKNLNLKF